MGKEIRVRFSDNSIKFLDSITEKEMNRYLRLRVGKTRIIFKYENNHKELLILNIDFRGNIYK